LTGEYEKKPLWRNGHRWKDNIKLIDKEFMKFGSGQGVMVGFVNTVMNFNGEFLDQTKSYQLLKEDYIP
jgi:hypothetical protein